MVRLKDQLTAEEALTHLTKLLASREKRGVKNCKKFSHREMALLEDIFLERNYSNLIFYVTDFISENYQSGMEIINAPTIRRIDFLKNILIERNATKAAIKSGYSPKSAKQQGYRTLKWIIKAQKAKSNF